MLKLYHGSPKLFFEFKIGKEYSLRSAEFLAEGYGIYMTEDMDFARSYGKHLYEISVDEKDVSDFTNVDYVKNCIEQVLDTVGIPKDVYFDVEELAQQVVKGEISVVRLYKEINNLLDSQEGFYFEFEERITYEENCIFEEIKNAYYDVIKDIVCYYDKSFNKKVYICFRNSEKLQIVAVYTGEE